LFLLAFNFHVFGEQQYALDYEEDAYDVSDDVWEDDDDYAEDYAEHCQRWFRDGDAHFL
jgi:hypothetical protein